MYKLKQTILGLLAFAAIAIASSAAHAQGVCGAGSQSDTQIVINQSGNCTISGNVTATSGDVFITATGVISITGTVTATGGHVYINGTTGTTIGGATSATQYVDLRTGTGANLSIGSVTSGDYLYMESASISSSGNLSTVSYIQATDSGIQSINIKGTVTSSSLASSGGGNILLFSQGPIATGTISTSNQTYAGSVDIKTYLGGGATPFILGGTNNNNGVNGNIISSTVSGGLEDKEYSHGGLYITNGLSADTGDITITASSNISVIATSSKNGCIGLNANAGTVTLPSGSISANGSSGQAAGFIFIFAKTITAPANSTITASQDATAPALSHGITLAASTINFSGTTTGLAVHADGAGDSTYNAYVDIIPYQAAYITDTENVTDLFWYLYYNSFGAYYGALSFNGASGSPLLISANGSNSDVTISGYPISFSGGALTVQSQGAANHQIYIGVNLGFNGSPGLTFNNTGPVSIDGSATASGTGGTITINTDKTTFSAPASFAISANGPASGSGNAGTIDFYPHQIVTGSPIVSFNLLGSGTGNGGTLNAIIGTGTLTLGTGSGSSQVNANSGPSGGNAGTVSINTGGALNFDGTANAIQASAQAGNGAGGQITITSASIADSGATTIYAQGKGTGTGGTISITTGTMPGLGSGTNPLYLEANGGANGPGGTVKVSASTITENAAISVLAGTNQVGGNVSLTSTGTITLQSTLNADGNGTGNGGTVTITAATFTQGANAITAHSSGGTGGTVNVTTSGTHALTTGSGGIDVSNSSASGIGGNINLTAGGVLTIAGPLNANGGTSSGHGGTIIGRGTQVIVGNNWSLTATASGASDSGGAITLNSTTLYGTIGQGVHLSVASVGNGGTIQLANLTTVQTSALLDASSSQKNGGGITFTNGSTSGVSLSVASGSTITAAAGTSGNGGTITANLTTTYTYDIPQIAGILNVSSGTGTGGSIKFNETDGKNLSITSAGTYQAGTGSLTFTGTNDVSFAIGSLTGNLIATGKSITTGTVASGAITVKTLNATSGNISFTANSSALTLATSGSTTADISATGTVTMSALSMNLAPSAASGKDFISGSAITLSTPSGNGSIVMGSNLSSPSGTVTITTTGTGGISQSNINALIIANTASLTTQTGNITGMVGSSALATKLNSLSVKTSNPGAGSASIYNTDNGSGLTLNTGESIGGSLSLISTKAITLNDMTVGGAITVTANTGLLQVNPSLNIATTAGNIAFQSGGTMQIGQNSTVIAVGNLSLSITGAPVNACVDTGGSPGPSCRPANATVTVDPGAKIYWPSNSADVQFSTSGAIATALNSRTLSFNSDVTNGIILLGASAAEAK